MRGGGVLRRQVRRDASRQGGRTAKSRVAGTLNWSGPRLALFREARGKLGDVDNGAFVCALADFFRLVPGFHAELNAAAVHGDHFRRKRHHGSYGRGGEVVDVYVRAHGVEAGFEERQHGVARGQFHVADHVRRGEHARALRPQERDGGFAGDEELLFGSGADGDVGHGSLHGFKGGGLSGVCGALCSVWSGGAESASEF